MLVYGKNVAQEIINKNIKINKVYLQENFDDEIKNSLNKYKITYLKNYEMDKKFSGNHQGIVLDIEDYKYASINELIKENELLLMLDHIEDPHNFGAIIRTAEAAGVYGIIIPDKRSVSVNSTVCKTSVGTIFDMKIAKVTNIANTIELLKKNGFWIVGTDMEGTSYDKIDYKGSTCIVCGNEGSGMSRLTKDKCDFIATIPMIGEVNSLNASVATAIVLFEAVKCRR